MWERHQKHHRKIIEIKTHTGIEGEDVHMRQVQEQRLAGGEASNLDDKPKKGKGMTLLSIKRGILDIDRMAGAIWNRASDESNWKTSRFIIIRSRNMVIALSVLSTVASVGLSVGCLALFSLFIPQTRFEMGLLPSITIPLLIAPIVSYITLNQSYLLTKAVAEVELLSRIDYLTGLNNKRFFFELVEREMGIAIRYNFIASLLLIDLDHFKRVNDRYGHLVGDQVLQVVANVIANALRSTDIVGRFGGEELIIFLPNTNCEEAVRAAERLKREISDTVIDYKNNSISVTASIGITSTESGTYDIEELIQYADSALYRAKSEGRDRVKWLVQASERRQLRSANIRL